MNGEKFQKELGYQGYTLSLAIDVVPGILVEKCLSLRLVRFQLSKAYGNRYLSRASNGNRLSITIVENISTVG